MADEHRQGKSSDHEKHGPPRDFYEQICPARQREEGQRHRQQHDELENIAVANPAIREAAVVARPDARWGERPLLVAVVAQITIDGDPAFGSLAPDGWFALDSLLEGAVTSELVSESKIH